MADTPAISTATVGHLVKVKRRIWPVLGGEVMTHLFGTARSPTAARICLGLEHPSHPAGLWGPSSWWQSPDHSRVPPLPASSQPWVWHPGLLAAWATMLGQLAKESLWGGMRGRMAL